MKDVVRVLLGAGLAVTVLSALGALTARRAATRLHFVTPVTSLGFPLVGLSIALQDGWGLTTAQVAFIVLVVAFSGPLLGSATGRMVAQRDGALPPDGPQ